MTDNDLIERCTAHGWTLRQDGDGYELTGNGSPANFGSEESVRVWLDRQGEGKVKAQPQQGITLLHGDCRNILKTLPEKSVQCVVTSPPYYGLRDYGTGQWDGGDVDCDHFYDRSMGGRASQCGGTTTQSNASVYRGTCGKCGATRTDKQIGLEATPAAYVAALVEVFREVRRVLRDDGVLWLNLGDSYAGDSCRGQRPGNPEKNGGNSYRDGIGRVPNTPAKNLLGIPWRVAFALQDDGWYLRSDIIWSKPNPTPESVTDRPTRAHEYLFLLAKRQRYYYDADAIAEPVKQSSIDRINQPTFDEQTGGPKDYGESSNRSQRKTLENFAKRSKGGGARAFRGQGAHTTNPANREGRDMSQVGVGLTRNKRTVWEIATRPYSGAHFATMPEALIEPCILAGSKAGDTILDLFGGSGTVAKVAMRYQRNAILIDLNHAYIELQEKRTDKVQLEMFV